MDKDNRYWNTHIEVFNKFFNELDKDIADRIYINYFNINVSTSPIPLMIFFPTGSNV